jgi:hypothetical protein
MHELSVDALTRAWLTTVVALALLLIACVTADVWNTQVYLRSLPNALQLVADGPPPAIDRWY